MKKYFNKKNIIIVFIILIVISISLFFVLNKKVEKKKIKENKDDTVFITDEGVVEDKIVDGLKIADTTLTVKDNVSRLVTNVYNNTSSDYILNEYKISVYDKDDNIIITLPGYVGEVIESGKTKIIDSSVDKDLSNAVRIEFEVIK